ncbi:hypothetical protein ATCC90586_005555 [Pythium insidiosum]|nr:hypothetical protein ATCC90586_005555 [Pythium insidiosum]
MVFSQVVRRVTQRAAHVPRSMPAHEARRAFRQPAAVAASASFGTKAATPAASRPVHHTADVTGVLVGVAAVGALVGVAKMWWDASSAPAGRGASASRQQHIARDDLAQFFEELKASVQELFVGVTQLPQIDEQFRKHLKSQNIEVGEEEYKQALQQQLFEVLQNIEQQVVGARGWSSDSFAHALELYGEDEVIARLQKELGELMQSVFPAPELPEHLTPEKVLVILEALVVGMEKAMRSMLEHARNEGITDPAKALEEFQQIYLDQVQQLTFEEMKKHDIPADLFNIALQKFHGENAEFRRKVEALYAQQAAAFRRMGLDISGSE